jgi:hypothetical protein
MEVYSSGKLFSIQQRKEAHYAGVQSIQRGDNSGNGVLKGGWNIGIIVQ